MATSKQNIFFFSVQSHQPPEFKVDKRKQYVGFGKDNNYPQYLLDNYDKSPIHNAICNGKINYIVGSGLKVSDYLGVDSLASAKALIRSVNEYEDADDINRKLATDLVIFGGFYTELIPSKAKGLSEVYHLPFQNLRVDKEDDSIWYYTNDWKSRDPFKNDDFVEFHEFKGTFEAGKRYINFYKSYRAGVEHYALPDYLASNSIIELEWRVDNFLLNNVKNGFSAGFIINFANGTPEPEEMADIEKKIKSKFTGDENGGSFVLNFSEGKDRSAEILAIPTNGHDDRFTLLSQWIADKLIIAHNIPNAALFGIQVSGKLGTSQELPVASFLFQTQYVNNKQLLLEKFWNDILMIKDVNAKYQIIEIPQYRDPISNEMLVNILTEDELRELAGYEPKKVKTEVTKFSADNNILDFLAGEFVLDKDFQDVVTNDVYIHSFAEAQKFEDDINLRNRILGIIKLNPDVQAQGIAEALEVTPKKVMAQIEILAKQGLVKLPEGQIEITKKGEQAATEEDLIIVYKYALRPDAPSLVDGSESRPFCKNLMELSKTRSWTLQQIQAMNNGQKLDVFAHKGGWYTKKGTDIHVPYCRHMWTQRLVKIRRNG
jgi:hypothetical protein